MRRAIEAARWNDFNERLERALDIREDIYVIENQEIGQINYAMERLRLRERRLELDQELTPEALAEIDSERAELDEEYDLLQIQTNCVI